jgi:hypothetical protein
MIAAREAQDSVQGLIIQSGVRAPVIHLNWHFFQPLAGEPAEPSSRTVVVVQRVPWWGVISSAGSPALLVAGSTVCGWAPAEPVRSGFGHHRLPRGGGRRGPVGDDLGSGGVGACYAVTGLALRRAVAVTATAVMLGLLAWFGAELISAGHQIGLAERALAGTQALWPLVVVLTCLRKPTRYYRLLWNP